MKKLNVYAQAAAMIRAWLKAKGIPAKVTSKGYSMGSSIGVDVEDLRPPVMQEVKAYAAQFQYGHFDGMQDMYEYSNSRKDIPQAKYVFVNNHLSEALRQKIWSFAVQYFGLQDAPADAALAGRYRSEKWGIYGDEFIYRIFTREDLTSQRFWNELDTEALAA